MADENLVHMRDEATKPRETTACGLDAHERAAQHDILVLTTRHHLVTCPECRAKLVGIVEDLGTPDAVG